MTSTQPPLVQPFFHRESSTWSYVVADESSRHAVVIDAALDFDSKAARTGTGSVDAMLGWIGECGFTVDWILETHAHADHLSAAQHVRKAVGGMVAIGAGIRAVQSTFAPLFVPGEDFRCDGSQFDHLFDDGDAFAVGDIHAQVIAVPGHTADAVAYLIGDALFVGDSLFMPDSGSARCDFPGGDAAQLFRSVRRLFELPDTTRVFVCHDYGAVDANGNRRQVACETSIGAQKQHNIHAREGVSESEFVSLRTARDATLSLPALMLPAIQVNIRAGHLPPPAANGLRYLVLPLNRF